MTEGEINFYLAASTIQGKFESKFVIFQNSEPQHLESKRKRVVKHQGVFFLVHLSLFHHTLVVVRSVGTDILSLRRGNKAETAM